ncbi:MAG: 50S ribosomal protein L4 [SAR202 cluster bacterium]|jgi:large subunit ribosomal protein L4|nr:50S ribosomal protein L4 [SAR202 cluster bacterium]
MELSLKNMQGATVGSIEVSDAVFDTPLNKALIHQVMVAQLANKRAGTHSTKTRAEVRGGGRKPWRQKGTGRARQGSIRSPQWRGGGVTFGPKPRDYTQATPKKMRRAAIKSLLSQKARDGEITVVEEFVLPAFKTQEVLKALAGLEIATNTKTLVVNNANTQKELWQACHNLQRVKSIPAAILNTIDLLNYDHLVLSVEAVRRIEELWAEERPRLPMRREGAVAAAQGGE